MTWATSVPILVFLGLSVLDVGPMYATDRRQASDRQTGHNKAGWLKVRVDVTSKRLMQQDDVESLQSDRESLKFLLIIGRDSK